MNTNLTYVPGSSTWVKQSMPRIGRSVRGNDFNFSGDVDHHVFIFNIAANDSLIGQRVMVKFYVSIHDAGWTDCRNFYASLGGPVTGVPGNTATAGTRLNVGEYTSAWPYNSSKKTNLTGAICATVTGNGDIYVRFRCDGAFWRMYDQLQAQSNCILMPLGG